MGRLCSPTVNEITLALSLPSGDQAYPVWKSQFALDCTC